MLCNYWQLKESLAIRDNLFLSVFEQYCQDMRFNTRVLEWTCKITDNFFEGARFLHTARSPNFSKAQKAVERLYSFFFPEIEVHESDQNLFYWLRPLAQKVGEGIALGYAEQGKPNEKRSEIKLYIETSQINAVVPLIELIVPKGANPPANTSRVMIAASIDYQKVCRPRVYYLWNSSILKGSTSSDWFNIWCTDEEIRLIKSSSSKILSIAFKEGRRDMIYLRAPFHQAELDNLVIKQLENYPIAYNQLDNLRWIGFSKWGEGLKTKELNVYFNSTFLT